MSDNLSHLTGRQGIEETLLDKYGQLNLEHQVSDPKVLAKLADEFLIGAANVHGAVSFYDFLKPGNKNKKVYICNGSACLCAGTQEKLKDALMGHFNESEVGEMCCLGRCHENFAFQYLGRNYSGEEAFSKLPQVLKSGFEPREEYHVDSLGKRILLCDDLDEEQFSAELRHIINTDPTDLLREIDASGLRGRGGAGYPIAAKLKSCMNVADDTKFVICNADEGDPGAYSDRYLIDHKPLTLLLGMMAAGKITGASWGILYIRGEYPESVQKYAAIKKRLASKKLIGNDILGNGFSFHLKIIQAQGSYLCGEETALINSIEGQRPEVRIRPPYPTEKGLFNKPTVVNNVETLAFIPHILKNGGKAFSSIGTEFSKGTKLVSLDSHFKRPGVYEIEMGLPLKDLVYGAAGGFKHPVKALHIGGPLGGLVPVQKIDQLSIDFESFAEHGFLLGHASIISIPERMPMIEYLSHIFEFAAHESCGKCFPCRLGTKRAHELLSKAITDDFRIKRSLLEDLLETLEKGSLCAHGSGIPLPVRNALQYFKSELTQYLTE